ncbi:uncharacterized protein EAE98_010082 [Botrytis deweyae]|uniref:Uncharacterized protein n=1 Tax=Botrytis deweyae TaxID=2478750 RepID=A0ABQ7IA10_9HELO|nr:uncharacterized protein EAE98_010082 [Botrytis deweyae]KAF7917666.1 hypothetical protein EAE98_010082 [Botrytis deweyae]
MVYVHVGKTPVPQCIVPSFSNEVFYPGSAPAGVTPQYFTTLNVYQQWLQIFGPHVPLPEDERNLPGYPQSNLYTETGEEGPRYRYCSKERVWKPRSYFPFSNGRFLCTCFQCKGSDIRREARRRGESLENRNADLPQGIQPNQDVIARFSQPGMPIVNTDQRKYSVANLPLMPKAKPYTAKPVPKCPMPAPVLATPALGPAKETISRLEEIKVAHSETERLRSRLFGHGRMKKLFEANLEKLTMATDRVSEESENNRGKRLAEAARFQDLISKEDDLLNKTLSDLDDLNLAIDLMTELSKDDIGYRNNNEDTVLPSVEKECTVAPSNSPENFDNTSDAGVELADQTNDLLRFSPMLHGYPPLDEDGHVLSNSDPSGQDPKSASGLDGTVEKESGDGTGDVDTNSELDTLATVSAGVPHADSSMILRDQDIIDPNFQQLSNTQTNNPQPQEIVDLNPFRALSDSQEVQDQHAPSYQAQSRQPSPHQRFQLQARTPSASRDLNPHWPYQASGHNSNHSQPPKATNAAAQRSPLTAHTPDLNPNPFGNPNPAAVFQFGQSTTLRDSGHYGNKIAEDVEGVQSLASQQTRETAKQAQQYQPNGPTKTSQLVQKSKNVYGQVAQQVRLAQEARELRESHDELAQERLSQPTRAVQQPKRACEQLAQDPLTEEQIAQNATIFYERQASEKRNQQDELTQKASLAHERVAQEQPAQEQPVQPNYLFQLAKLACDRLAQDQLAQKQRAESARDAYDQIAYEKRTQQKESTCQMTLTHDQMDQDQLAQRAMHARDVYDQIAHEKRTRQNESTYETTLAHDQLDEDEMDQDQFYQYQLDQDQLAEDQLAQKAMDARDVYDQRACEIRDRKNILAKHVHYAHDQLSQLSQQTQLAQQHKQEIRVQIAEYQARLQRQTFESLPNFRSLPIRGLAQPTERTQLPKRRAEESPESPQQHEPEHSIRRSKRARHRAETEAEMREREDLREERIQQRVEIQELQQTGNVAKRSIESKRRCKKG